MYNKLILASFLCGLLGASSIVFGMEQHPLNIVIRYNSNNQDEWVSYNPKGEQINTNDQIELKPGSYTLKYNDSHQKLYVNQLLNTDIHHQIEPRELVLPNYKLSSEQINIINRELPQSSFNNKSSKVYIDVNNELLYISKIENILNIRQRSKSALPIVKSKSLPQITRPSNFSPQQNKSDEETINENKKKEIVTEPTNNPIENAFYIHDSNNDTWYKFLSTDRYQACTNPNNSGQLKISTVMLSSNKDKNFLIDERGTSIDIGNSLTKKTMDMVKNVVANGQKENILHHIISARASKTEIYATMNGQLLRVTRLLRVTQPKQSSYRNILMIGGISIGAIITAYLLYPDKMTQLFQSFCNKAEHLLQPLKNFSLSHLEA